MFAVVCDHYMDDYICVEPSWARGMPDKGFVGALHYCTQTRGKAACGPCVGHLVVLWQNQNTRSTHLSLLLSALRPHVLGTVRSNRAAGMQGIHSQKSFAPR